MTEAELRPYIQNALMEDVGDGDHSSLSTVDIDKQGRAQLICKQEGILAGVEAALYIFKEVDADLRVDVRLMDGALVKDDDIAFVVEGRDRSILTAERLVLNVMQRMSGVATLTRKYVEACAGTATRILDTRKTTPGFRIFEKWGVRIGGGVNHRFGLYDMIMIKDNHIDYAGGITKAIEAVHTYLATHNKHLNIEIECRNFKELEEILTRGGVDRIMLDNFNIEDAKKAVSYINKAYETEISGGINLDTVGDYAQCGANYISVGALTHSYTSIDMSLKAF